MTKYNHKKLSAILKQEGIEKFEEQLELDGFHYYHRKQVIVMGRPLLGTEMPKEFTVWGGEKLWADEIGYMILFNPINDKENPKPMHLYPSYPVKYTIFAATYQLISDIVDLNAAEISLIAQGCLPFYKSVGVYAKQLTEETEIYGLEHKTEYKVPAGNWLAIGIDGEPYDMPDQRFRELYEVE